MRLIDPEGRIAEGKALDILQSSPVEPFTTRVTAATSFAAAAGADVIVLADLVTGGEIAGEAGLALLRQLARMETTAPFLFAGGVQRELMTRAIDGAAPVAARGCLDRRRWRSSPRCARVTAALMDASPAIWHRRGRGAAARRGDRLGCGDRVQPPDRRRCSRRTTCRR